LWYTTVRYTDLITTKIHRDFILMKWSGGNGIWKLEFKEFLQIETVIIKSIYFPHYIYIDMMYLMLLQYYIPDMYNSHNIFNEQSKRLTKLFINDRCANPTNYV